MISTTSTNFEVIATSTPTTMTSFMGTSIKPIFVDSSSTNPDFESTLCTTTTYMTSSTTSTTYNPTTYYAGKEDYVGICPQPALLLLEERVPSRSWHNNLAYEGLTLYKSFKIKFEFSVWSNAIDVLGIRQNSFLIHFRTGTSLKHHSRTKPSPKHRLSTQTSLLGIMLENNRFENDPVRLRIALG